MHRVVDLPGYSLEQRGQDDNNNLVAEHEEQHCEGEVAVSVGMIIGNHRPPCLSQHLHEDELAPHQWTEVWELWVVVVGALLSWHLWLLVENLHT